VLLKKKIDTSDYSKAHQNSLVKLYIDACIRIGIILSITCNKLTYWVSKETDILDNVRVMT
jgi:hypothetical protein